MTQKSNNMKEKSELCRINPENEMEFANLMVIAQTHPIDLTPLQLQRVQRLINEAIKCDR